MAGNDNYIQLKENKDILRLGIRDEKGNDTGEYLEFDLEDINLPTRYQQIIELDKKARADLENKKNIILKKQDHKGKKLLSSNEEELIKAVQEFYKKEVEIYNMFLGERGVEKLLNGRILTWGAFEEINQIIEESILPQLTANAENINKKIKSKYSDKRDDVIE